MEKADYYSQSIIPHQNNPWLSCLMSKETLGTEQEKNDDYRNRNGITGSTAYQEGQYGIEATQDKASNDYTTDAPYPGQKNQHEDFEQHEIPHKRAYAQIRPYQASSYCR